MFESSNNFQPNNKQNMKNFLTKTAIFTNIRVFFVPTVLLFIGILFMSMNIKAQSALDSFNPGPNAAIRAVVVQPDGKIIIGGDFTSMPGSGIKHIARLNPNGSVDSSFAPNPNYPVYAIALQPDGKIIAGGDFTTVWGDNSYRVSRNGLARFNANGTLDNTFDPNPDSTVRSITVQPNGKIIIGGSFTTVAPNYGAAVTRNRIARLNADGTLDASFDPNVDGDVNAAAIQTDGKIIIAGGFNTVTPNGGTSYVRHRIARLNTDGTPDTTFELGVNYDVLTVVIQSDGKFIAGGFFNNILTNGSPTAARNRIARFNADGTLDTTFDPNASGTVYSLAIQPDGKIVAGGYFTTIAPNGGAPVTRNRMARINLDGTLDNSFNPNVNGQVFSLAVQSDGKIFIGGLFNSINGVPRDNFMRLEKGGLPDLWLYQNTNNTVYTTAPQTDGKILVGGDFTTIGGVTRNRLARLNADSSLDTMFNPNVNGAIYAIHVQTDGKILIGGDFTNVGGQLRNRIVRLNANGSIDNSFNANANNSVRAFTVQPDGKILVGGAFTIISGQTRNYIARLNTNGSLDSTFYNPNVNNQVHTITLQNDKILVGGDFTSVGGQPQTGIVRLFANGFPDNTFNQTANGGVTALVLQTDGKILIGGSFTGIGYIPSGRIARLNTDGSVDMSFSANANAAVNSIAVQSDGFILISGSFTGINGYGTPFIARLKANGSPDTYFNPYSNAVVRSLTLQPDGKILVGGQFTQIGGQSRSYLARLNNTVAATSVLDVYPTTVLLTRDGAATQFSRVVFEQSVDNGATWTTLGTATNTLTSTVINDKNDANTNPSAPVSTGYVLTGQNIPTGQNVLIRARGFYRAGEKNSSEIVEDKVQNVFLNAPIVGNASVSGRILTADGAGLRSALVKLTCANGDFVTKRTNAFGYFQFDEIAAGQTVVISVSAINYTFSPQIVNVNDNVADLIFTAD